MSGVWIFIAAILVVVMVHESGHFFVAKAFNFKATKYFLGFGPTIWSTTRGETEYGIKALPLGGFVKIVGMNPYEEIAPEDQARAYSSKPRWQRTLVILAGPATHFVVAFVILLVISMTMGFPTGEVTTEISGLTTTIGEVETPASQLGLEVGDRIVGIDGQRETDWLAISDFIRSHPGEEVTFSIEKKDGEVTEETVRLGSAIFGPEGVREYATETSDLRPAKEAEEVGGFLGISPSPEFETKGFFGAAGQAADFTWLTTKGAFVGIGDTFGMVFGGELWDALTGSGERAVDEGPLGIVGASKLANESISSGNPLFLVELIVGFTIFVGLMNLLPLPPLDGGHLAVLAYESIFRREVDVRKLIPIAAAVISFFVVLFIAVLYLDLARPIRIPF